MGDITETTEKSPSENHLKEEVKKILTEILEEQHEQEKEILQEKIKQQKEEEKEIKHELIDTLLIVFLLILIFCVLSIFSKLNQI